MIAFLKRLFGKPAADETEFNAAFNAIQHERDVVAQQRRANAAADAFIQKAWDDVAEWRNSRGDA